MRKGKLLECTLRIVQESLKDKDDTEIYSNHEIINSAGRRREFDIVIKSFINGFNLTVVMECKDYAGPVAVEKIEAFHSKCLRIPEINKKVFVSRRGFQADAIKAAEEFGIETYEVEDVELYSWSFQASHGCLYDSALTATFKLDTGASMTLLLLSLC